MGFDNNVLDVSIVLTALNRNELVSLQHLGVALASFEKVRSKLTAQAEEIKKLKRQHESQEQDIAYVGDELSELEEQLTEPQREFFRDLRKAIRERDEEIASLKAAFEPVESWYCGEENPTPPTFRDMVADAIADLQADRAETITQAKEIASLREDREKLHEARELIGACLTHHHVDHPEWNAAAQDWMKSVPYETSQALNHARQSGEGE